LHFLILFIVFVILLFLLLFAFFHPIYNEIIEVSSAISSTPVVDCGGGCCSNKLKV
jgi:hypothetical protein